jgi:WhiB family redox-sensing transcriptional regulator
MIKCPVMANYLTDLSITPPDEYIEYILEARDWIDKGLCRGADPDLFYPERGESTREAKSVCAICPVKRECLEYGVSNVEKFGIWGGASERERRAIRRRRRKRLAA